MDLQITEQQKKMLTVLITVLMSVMIFTTMIQPLQLEIKTNKELVKETQQTADGMKAVVEDQSIEPEYEKLKTESKQVFEQNYKSYKANEKVEEVLRTLGISLKSLTISPYNVIDEQTYEKSVVQPKTVVEYQEMKANSTGELMNLFLVSRLDITVTATPQQYLQIVNAINNIPPQGPGAVERNRYCMQIPSLTYSEEEQGEDISISINMYGMEPPPVS